MAASIDNVIKFTIQVSAEFPDMPPDEQARLGAQRAEEWEASGAEEAKQPGARAGKQSIRELIENDFIAGGYDITIDREEFYEQHGIELTYQNLRSAMRAHYDDTYRVVIKENDVHFRLTRQVKAQAQGVFDEQIGQAVKAERARVCQAIERIFNGSPRDNALLEALKIIVNNGGE